MFPSEGGTEMPGTKTFVFSRTLRQQDYPRVTIVSENAKEVLVKNLTLIQNFQVVFVRILLEAVKWNMDRGAYLST